MPSRAQARSLWTEEARDAYRSAAQGVKGAYKNCVKVAGRIATIDGNCMQKAAGGLSTSLAGAWTD
jgi:hypothetical protein